MRGILPARPTGGLTWTTVSYDFFSWSTKPFFIDTNNGWIAGPAGRIYKSTDSGASWTLYQTGVGYHVNEIHFHDANNGVVVGNFGYIFTTSNGGLSWTQRTSNTTDDFWDITFIDSNNGWAVGENGLIRKTSDGGATWTNQTSGTSAILYGVRFTDANTGIAVGAGGTIIADLIASLEGFSREELDAYAVQTHHRAAAATQNGHFAGSLVPVKDKEGQVILAHDECIRPGSSAEKMQVFPPVFQNFLSPSINNKIKNRYPELSELQHLHHIGNSPTAADGASVLLIGSMERGKELGLEPKAKIRSFDSSSCEPVIMLLGGQLSVENAVRKAGLEVADIDLHNFAEAFSATCLKYQRDLKVDSDKFNVNGCTMSMGHAQGASGAMITTTLLDEMERRDVQFGVAGISGGAGLGAGLVLERV